MRPFSQHSTLISPLTNFISFGKTLFVTSSTIAYLEHTILFVPYQCNLKRFSCLLHHSNIKHNHNFSSKVQQKSITKRTCQYQSTELHKFKAQHIIFSTLCKNTSVYVNKSQFLFKSNSI